MSKDSWLRFLANLTFIVFAFSTAILIILLTSTWIYRPFVAMFKLDQGVGLPYSQLITTYDEIIRFLLNPQEVDFALSYFSSSAQGIQHFADVKFLIFMLIVSGLISFALMFYFLQQSVKKRLKRKMSPYFYFAMALPMFLLIAMIFSFDRVFILFHQVVFTNDYWLFNPASDPVIQILPQEFFFVLFFLAILGYELIQYLIFWWIRR